MTVTYKHYFGPARSSALRVSSGHQYCSQVLETMSNRYLASLQRSLCVDRLRFVESLESGRRVCLSVEVVVEKTGRRTSQPVKQCFLEFGMGSNLDSYNVVRDGLTCFILEKVPRSPKFSFLSCGLHINYIIFDGT